MRHALRRWVEARSAKHQQVIPVRAWFVVIGLAAVAVMAWSALLTVLPASAPYPQPLAWVEVAAGVALASMVSISFQFRSDRVLFNLREIPVLLGTVYLRPSGLLLAVLVGVLCCDLLRGQPMVRVLFNTTNGASESAAALAVFHFVAGGSSPAELLGWGACALAVLAACAANLLGMIILFSVLGRSVPRSILARAPMEASVVASGLSAGIGLVAVLLVWASRWATVLLIVLVACGIAVQRAFARLGRRYASLDGLYHFTLRASQIGEHEVVPTLLEASRQVLAVDYAELLLPLGAGWHSYASAGDAAPVEAEITESADLMSVFGGNDLVVMDGRSDLSSAAAQVLAVRGLREATASTIDVGAEAPAVLVLGRLGDNVGFGEDDLRLMRTVAANAGTAIRSAQLLAEVRQQAAAREYEALHDGLTGLANRVLFHQTLRNRLEQREVGSLVGVMLLDLDGFKDVNDTLGHHAGDAILVEVANRLMATVGARGLVARLGGDEFAFVITEPTDIAELSDIGRQILGALSLPLTVGGLQLALRASLGASHAPQHGEDSSLLLRRADVAMYEAKSRGGGIELYDPGIDHHSTRRLLLSTDLRQAIGRDDLQVWYQPQASLVTGEIVGCEALLRWHHPIHGEVSPEEFIPAAEQSGLIIPLTWWALETAIGQIRAWHDRGLMLKMAVNMSGRTLFDNDVVGRIESLLGAAGVDPHWLTVEVTESSVMADQDRSRRIIEALHGLGVQLAIDDFGTGYSSLGRLKRLPIQVVKIDRSFVMQMSRDQDDAAIVRSTIDLARHMGHAVVAEGVEDQETWDQLAALGCDGVQGFLLAKAMPADRFEAWLRQRLRGHLTLLASPAGELASEHRSA